MKDSKQQIIQSALKIISEKGISGITTRKIAEDAGVNIAAVNYYFHSKNKLVEESLTSFMSKLENIFSILNDNKETQKSLQTFLNKFIDYAIIYPGVIKSLFFQMTTPDKPNAQLAKSMRKNFELLKRNLKQNTGLKEEKILNFMALEIISAIVYPILLNCHLKEVSLIDYSNQNDRKIYVNLLINKITKK